MDEKEEVLELPELTMENITPVRSEGRGRLLIQPFKQAGATSSGLLMSDGDGHATPVYGKVIKASEGCAYKAGDALLFRRYAIDSLKAYTASGEIEVYLLEESEVIGVVSGPVEPRGKQSNVSQIAEKQTQTNGKKESSGKEASSKEESQEDL